MEHINNISTRWMSGGHIEILIHRTDLLTTQLGLHEYQVSQEDSLHQPMPHPLDLPFVVRGKTKQKLVPSGVLLVLLLLTFVVCGWLVIAICVPLAQSLKMEMLRDDCFDQSTSRIVLVRNSSQECECMRACDSIASFVAALFIAGLSNVQRVWLVLTCMKLLNICTFNLCLHFCP